MNRKQLFGILILALIGMFVVAACGTSSPTDSAELVGAAGHQDAAEPDGEHAEGEDEDALHQPEDHMAGAHDVPAEAAAVPNPVAATDESIAAGAALFAANCAICHGESGAGDGPAAAGMEPPPADLTAEHVLPANSDGALFYIISHGKPDTPMPAWANILTEEERWQLINFLRTFSE